MLVQVTTPRPMINTADSPEHVRIHTLRKPKVSKGDVVFVLGGGRQIEVEPVATYPITGENAFEALEFYLPFSDVFGTNKPTYDERRIQSNIEAERFHRVTTKAPSLMTGPIVPAKDAEHDALTGVQLAIVGSMGYSVIVRSAYRTEGAGYEERTFNFTIHCPVSGGGMVRIAGCPVDIANPTFNPYAPIPGRTYQDLVLLEAFNRTHKPRTDDVEARKRARIQEAEANIRMHEGKLIKGTPRRR